MENNFRRKRPNATGLCICQRKVKWVTYNVENGNIIIVGSICLKKFGLEENKYMNKEFSECFKNHLEKNRLEKGGILL